MMLILMVQGHSAGVEVVFGEILVLRQIVPIACTS